jgi:hypothetical protein
MWYVPGKVPVAGDPVERMSRQIKVRVCQNRVSSV